jgi:hypothetical protein
MDAHWPSPVRRAPAGEGLFDVFSAARMAGIETSGGTSGGTTAWLPLADASAVAWERRPMVNRHQRSEVGFPWPLAAEP